ncbi:uncharacterized protein LOC110055475, partial [Orbicella faveolata]|uniref:uncharacterized protein LOC110055475 n=1 Tax=Orbicella faveolata TaxID=48498 RepID=UPI0009E336BA
TLLYLNMRMSSEKRTLWVIVRVGDVTSDLKRFQFNCAEDVEEEDKVYEKAKFLEALTKQLGLSAVGKTNVLKLRNARGSLIPLSRRTPENTVTSPYILEVCERHSSVKPIPRRVDVACYNETYQRKLEMFTKRISKLEDTVPKLSLLRDAKLSAEMKDLEVRLQFLHSKLKEADSRQWKGMFTKHPLW